jgi:NTE family protein
MQTSLPLFEGLLPEHLEQIWRRLEPRRFPRGAVLLMEGDTAQGLYIIQSGSADIYVADREGREQYICPVGPGATLGEMSLFTGEPVSATVRAATELDVLILWPDDFHELAAMYPQIYRHLGALLAHRLRDSVRRSVGRRSHTVTLLEDQGAPPLLGYALAASVAWHARASVLLLVISDGSHPELEGLAAAMQPRPLAMRRTADPLEVLVPAGAEGHAAHLLPAQSTGRFALESWPGTLEDLTSYDHILVQFAGGISGSGLRGRHVRLGTPGLRQPAGAAAPSGTILGWVPGSTMQRPDRDGVLRVPPLAPADDQALRTGLLPATTAAGRALGWAARDLAGLKIGLALGAGTEKGYAHLGVLKVLERAGVPVDFIAGTSVGSTVAAMYAAGDPPDLIADRLDHVAQVAFRPVVPVRALLSSAKVSEGVKAACRGLRFVDLDIPAAIVAADLASGREVVFRHGLIWPAIMASISIPGIWPAQRIGGYVLVDGGIVNPVPSRVVCEMGADIVIAVKLGRHQQPAPVEATATAPGGPVPAMMPAITRTLEIMQSKITTETAAAATIQIEPTFKDEPSGGLRNFRAGRRYMRTGQVAAEMALPRLACALPWLPQSL